MDHLNSVRAALRSAAPVVAIPIPGHAPFCIRAKMLKGALKGVVIDSVEITETRWLKIKGHAGNVHTSCSIVPMSRYNALKAIREWSDKERKKRKVIALQGVLSAKEQRALKLKQAEKAGIAELIQAQKDEAEILSDARASVFPVLTPVDAETRESIIESYAAFRAQRGNRKRGAVIRWTLAKLRKDKAAMVIEKREYEERPSISPYARRRRYMTGCKTVLRRKKDAVKYAALIYQIGKLEKQYDSLYPPVRHEWHSQDGCYYLDSWTEKPPKELTYTVPWGWGKRHDDKESNIARLTRMSERLKNARADIRALTPPEDEAEELSQAA